LANLTSREHLGANETTDHHPGDPEFGSSFFGRHLPALGPLTGAIDGNTVPIAEGLDPEAGPRVPFGRPPAYTVEKGSDGLVGKDPGKCRDELCRILIGSASVSARCCLSSP
jgi:hypothetical protein